MQTKLREEIDADSIESLVSVSDHKIGQNKYEISCGECAKTLYADKETSERIFRSIKQGLDNPFICEDCQEEYEEMAHRDR